MDDWTYQLARDKGYDMIHFYGTGYNLFWADEFVVISDKDFDQLTKTRILTTRGPCVLSSSKMLVCENSPFPHHQGVQRSDRASSVISVTLALLTGLLVLVLVILALVILALVRSWKNKDRTGRLHG